MSPAPISSAAAPAGPTGCMTGGGAGDCGVRDDGVEVGTFSVHVVSNSSPSIRTASPTPVERDFIVPSELASLGQPAVRTGCKVSAAARTPDRFALPLVAMRRVETSAQAVSACGQN